MQSTGTASDALAYLMASFKSSGAKRVISISGFTNAGKTTLATTLLTLFLHKGIRATLISLDDFFRDYNDPELPRDQSKAQCYDLPDSFHGDEFQKAVATLITGNPVEVPVIQIPRYDIPSNTRVGYKRIEAGTEMVIAEGLYAGMLLRSLNDVAEHLFIDTPLAVCRERRVAAEMKSYSVAKDRAEKRFDTLAQLSKESIMSQKKFADFIIQG